MTTTFWEQPISEEKHVKIEEATSDKWLVWIQLLAGKKPGEKPLHLVSAGDPAEQTKEFAVVTHGIGDAILIQFELDGTHYAILADKDWKIVPDSSIRLPTLTVRAFIINKGAAWSDPSTLSLGRIEASMRGFRGSVASPALCSPMWPADGSSPIWLIVYPHVDAAGGLHDSEGAFTIS